MKDILSIVDMKIKIEKNRKRLINKIKEDIKKHKEGKIERFPIYTDYMEEFQILSKKKVKELIKRELGEEELEYITNAWRNLIKQRYSREGYIKKGKIGDYAEELVKKKLEEEGWEVFKIFNYANEETKGWLKFNWGGLEKRHKKICKKLYSLSKWRGCHLPDFICFKKDYFKFVEVKAGKNVKWNEKQKKGIEKLEKLGYIVEILKPEFFEKEIDNLLKEK